MAERRSRPSYGTQLYWAVWKNLLLKCRNIRSTFKELAFPIYTFVLVSLLKAAIDLDVSNVPSEYMAEPIPPLDRTHAGKLCMGMFDRRGQTSATSGGVVDSQSSQMPPPPCLLLITPDTDETVAQIATRVATDLRTAPVLGVMTFGNVTAAKRYHLDHPGRVMALINVGLSGGCRTGSTSKCEVDYAIRVNATSMMAVRTGFNGKAEMEAGLFSIQELMHRSITAVIPSAASANQGREVSVRVKPMPTDGGGTLSLARARTKLSLVTSLYFVLAWIPTVQILLVNIVSEKQVGLKEAMRCMGLKDVVFWLAWFVSETAITCIAIVLVVIMGTYTGLFGECDLSLIFVTFLLFVSSLCTMSFAISVPFKQPKVAAAAGSAIIALFSFLFTILRVSGISGSAFWLLSLLSPVAMSSAGSQIWHGAVTWASIYDGERPLAAVLAFLWLDTILYLAVAVYLEGACGEGGWDLLWCLPKACRPWRRRGSLDDDIPLLEITTGGGGGGGELESGAEVGDEQFGTEGCYESEGGAYREAAVRLRGLRKVYGGDNDGGSGGNQGVVAVDGISLDLHAGQVYVLLGPNGAGKSTLMSMLTGSCAPTSGAVSVGTLRVDEPSDLALIREDLGYATQNDVLLEELTPCEHLMFFAGLRGLGVVEGAEETQGLMDRFGLREHEGVQVKNLSGGLKRRLSVAISLIGSPSLVVLDEPSSGMDARGRRSLWEALQSSKQGKTIVVSTHSMEEADAIADRIGIVVNGTLKADGDPMDLKAKYGLGYKVHCEMAAGWRSAGGDKGHQPQALVKRISEWAGQHVQGASAAEEGGGTEVTISLGQADVALFPRLFERLDADMENLGIAGYGLTSTSLEEVYLNICDDRSAFSDAPLQSIIADLGAKIQPTGPITPPGHAFNGWAATNALAWKIITVRWRDRRAAAHFVIYPCFVIVVAFTVFGNHYFNLGVSDLTTGSVPLSLAPWGGGRSIALTNATGHGIPGLASLYWGGELDADLAARIEVERWGQGAPGVSSGVVIEYNSTSLMAGTAALNSVYNAALSSGTGPQKVSVQVTVGPLPGRSATAHPQSYMLAFLLSMALLYAPTYIAEDIVREREHRLKHVLYVLGARSVDYWISHLTADALIFFAPIVVSLVAGAIAKSPAFMEPYVLCTLVVMAVYCLAMPACIYPITTIFTTSKAVLKWLGTVLLLVTTIPLTVMFTVAVSYPMLADPLALILSVFPSLGISWGIFKTSVAAIISKELERVPPGGAIGALGETKVTKLAFVMLLSAVSCFCFILFKDVRTFTRVKPGSAGESANSGRAEADDEDVAAERDRIEARGRDGAANLTLHRLRKTYGHGARSKSAVDSLSLSVGLGESFTLLGPNGAGKTSTMLMLTGEIPPCGGEAIVGGRGVYTGMLDIFPLLGICAQQDTLFDKLTAREHLWLCCALRGMKADDGETATKALLEGLGIEEWADRRSATFSGGTKRKLCVGMALASSPRTVLLDEPSTGLDPVSKRKLWSLLAALRPGRSMLLTTHSMAEAEVLSTRVGIMGGGILRCIGTPQHLKRRFGRGLYLKVRAPFGSRVDLMSLLASVVPSNMSVNSQDAAAEGDGESLGDVATLEFSLQLTGGDERAQVKVSLTSLFGAMEKSRQRLKIEDYSVTQVTLEQVFLRVTQQQEGDGSEGDGDASRDDEY